MKQTILIILILLIYSCNLNFREKKLETTSSIDTLHNSSIQNSNILTKNEDRIDIIDFKKRADSLISIILNKPTTFEIVIDTIEPSLVTSKEKSNISGLESFLVGKSEILIKHHFKISKPNDILSFTIYEAFFNYKDTLDSTFSRLRYLANGINANDDSILNVPGLTYENDYVLRLDKYLVWLNTKCAYGFMNHSKFVKSVNSSFINSNIRDSIVCRCGQVKCK